jgi:hypothetical protein
MSCLCMLHQVVCRTGRAVDDNILFPCHGSLHASHHIQLLLGQSSLQTPFLASTTTLTPKPLSTQLRPLLNPLPLPPQALRALAASPQWRSKVPSPVGIPRPALSLEHLYWLANALKAQGLHAHAAAVLTTALIVAETAVKPVRHTGIRSEIGSPESQIPLYQTGI